MKLAVESAVRTFAHDQEALLAAALKEMERCSLLRSVSGVDELTFDEEARSIRGGCRLTTWALYQLCKTVCPGLYKAVVDIAGGERQADHPASEYSFAEALDMVNRTVLRRFAGRLSDCQVLYNEKDHLIEGVVGGKYRSLSNVDLYERAKGVLDDQGARFQEAALYGRWMLLRFVLPKPSFVLRSTVSHDGVDRFFGGFHFSNHEAGMAAVRAGVLLLRETGRTASLSSVTGSAKLRHLGDQFDVKLMKLLASAPGKLQDGRFYAEKAAVLRSQLLGLGGRESDVDERRREDLAHQLSRRRLPLGEARRVVSSALHRGSYEPAGYRIESREDLARRTAYDLYNAAGREARRLPVGPRERLEQAAYALLLGKFILK